MKCQICHKEVEELYQEPVAPGTDAGTAKEVCKDCHKKAWEKVSEAHKKDSDAGTQAELKEKEKK
jgi:hypothetical protein